MSKITIQNLDYILNNNKLSWSEKGLLIYMDSLEDDILNVDKLLEISADGKDSINSIIKKLEKSGFIQKRKIRDSGGKFYGYIYDLYFNGVLYKSFNSTVECDSNTNNKYDALKEELINKQGLYLFYSNNKEILYIGKSNNLFSRIKTSLKHRNKNNDIGYFKYIKSENNINLHIFELYLINKYKPIFNVDSKDLSNHIPIQKMDDIENLASDFIEI